jgi:hypothetical protein
VSVAGAEVCKKTPNSGRTQCHSPFGVFLFNRLKCNVFKVCLVKGLVDRLYPDLRWKIQPLKADPDVDFNGTVLAKETMEL